MVHLLTFFGGRIIKSPFLFVTNIIKKSFVGLQQRIHKIDKNHPDGVGEGDRAM